MSFPMCVPRQGLYEASTDKKHDLGDVAEFTVDYGGGPQKVLARYVQWNNSASIAAGFACALAHDVDAPPWAVDTAGWAATNAVGAFAGLNCASMQGTATSNGATGYGWCAFYGPVTAKQLSQTLASNVVSLVSIHSAAANLGVVASTIAATSDFQANRIVGIIGATASNVSAASTGASGHYVILFGK